MRKSVFIIPVELKFSLSGVYSCRGFGVFALEICLRNVIDRNEDDCGERGGRRFGLDFLHECLRFVCGMNRIVLPVLCSVEDIFW